MSGAESHVRTSELEYDLPEGVIATRAAEPRDAARMMVVSRSDPALLQHRHVRDLPEFLRAGDMMVFNRTSVLPARLIGANLSTGGKVEGLFLHELASNPPCTTRWQMLIKARRARPGSTLTLLDQSDQPSDIVLTLVERASGDEGGWISDVAVGGRPVAAGEHLRILAAIGRTPLPPYILAARRESAENIPDPSDRARYQTVYADAGAAGSVAAPTAGLHFTPELLARLDAKGVQQGRVLLHVGTGTFKPVETESLLDHPMHSEWCSMGDDLAAQIMQKRATGAGRIIAVGTTSIRTLESYASWVDRLPEPTDRVYERLPAHIDTRLLISPGYRLRWVDGLMTNFHLPRSTLLALVAALFEREGDPGSGIARVRTLYTEAIRCGYRFYSYGDAMLILP
ncbi:MAG: tRNA preQ1(34) S-adenosylmethionine ribosyltransferase-isomerase QueA [Phycisphaeraceae bacterium]|nr:tRNA preQ1(34) S-adenosylmethionine ribosyltransferase-isomerase QueA [Phycisphaeraceae bacterium]